MTKTLRPGAGRVSSRSEREKGARKSAQTSRSEKVAQVRRRDARREPKQRRARETVEAVLDAVVRILKRGGIEKVTTNRIAEVAGVSVGSVYQYFPDKRAIFGALHDRHVGEISQIVESTLVTHANSSFEDLVRALVEALVSAHGTDPELHELLTTQVPHAGGERAFEERLRSTFRLAIQSRSKSYDERDFEKVLFILPHMVEGLAHGAALRRPAGLSQKDATAEAVRAVQAYLRTVLRG
ncbi:Transcriptional regulator, TetR family [Labilithrix luteola]|uniref:Transcriptional regulator, TetR family n=1 Tax=Labilithrix luteola TaxID=1391654 RepID=A0A0K1PW94_9BACT|nr:TetR/AcrR family transcriptional regulator [Labilithrix luteola]AKU97788.1 Transcriptional regulator, TetR family [Labilithrix luteola]